MAWSLMDVSTERPKPCFGSSSFNCAKVTPACTVTVFFSLSILRICLYCSVEIIRSLQTAIELGEHPVPTTLTFWPISLASLRRAMISSFEVGKSKFAGDTFTMLCQFVHSFFFSFQPQPHLRACLLQSANLAFSLVSIEDIRKGVDLRIPKCELARNPICLPFPVGIATATGIPTWSPSNRQNTRTSSETTPNIFPTHGLGMQPERDAPQGKEL
mmetsp:Transcript_28105/g.55033  ORF Transcript_28105/g.55033 Transcript_28105/m.55033 type:complete len:215 (+) Transcript_28105:903-1547(+)